MSTNISFTLCIKKPYWDNILNERGAGYLLLEISERKMNIDLID